MSVATSLLSATLSGNAAKIILRGRRSEEIEGFIATLPSGRWFPADLAWACDATPGCAWRLLNHSPAEVQPDDSVLALATRFAAGLDIANDLTQPPLRKHDSWRHQVEAYHFANAHEGAMLALRMGEGKSKVAVDLVVNRGCRTTLVLCPVSVRGVWRREFERHAGAPVDVLVLEKGSTKDKAAQADRFLKTTRRPAVVVVNYETARLPDFARWSLKRRWDCVILDESHRAKGHNTDIGKYVADLGKAADYRLALTGTPMPHSPLDIFAQYRFLDRGIFGSSFHHFRNRYAKMNQMFPGKVDQWLNQDELKERFSLLAFRVDGDVLSLPPFQHHERRCQLSAKAQRVYDSLEQELIAEVEGGVITAANALVRLLRLQQITSGFIVRDESETVDDVDDAKQLLLYELLSDMPDDEPVVVFCRFRYDLDIVRQTAEKLGRRFGELSGRRRDLTEHATMPDGIDVMGVQIQSGGVGIDLTRARYCVYFSIGFSLGDYEQSLARVHRPGQLRPVHYYHLIASGTVDEVVYGALEKRADIVNSVLEALKKGSLQ